MDKGITLEYSDNETQEQDAEISPLGAPCKKNIFIERHIRTLENPRNNTYFCQICNAELKTPMHAKTHYVSTKHFKNIELLRQQLSLLPLGTLQDKINLNSYNISTESPVPAIATDEVKYLCTVCNVTLVGKSQVNHHYNDEQHKRNLEFYCDLCNVKTISKEALLEHKFYSHQQKVEIFDLEEDGPLVPQAYASPKISKSPEAKNNMQSDLLPNMTWSCYECRKIFATERLLIEHRGTFPHNALDNLKLRYSAAVVDAFCSINDENNILCSLCDNTMKNVFDTDRHLISIKHVKRFKMAFKELCLEENLISEGDKETEIKIKENPESNRENEVSNEIIEEKNTDAHLFYCYICKREFDSKSEINIHALSFPHVELAKLKSETVSLGVPFAEYWTKSDDSYCCTLCDAELINTPISKHHRKGHKHKERLLRWCKDFATLKCNPVVDPKYFYCKTCELSLVGTTEAEGHYKMKPHLRRMELYCRICQVAHSSKELFQDHTRLAHQKNGSKDINITVSSRAPMDNQEDVGDKKLDVLEDKDPLEHSSGVSVKHQVYRELEKLIHTLYYSKSLPYNVSLGYLKKINKEIAELKRHRQAGAENSGKYLDRIVDYQSCNGSLGTASVNEHFRGVEVENQLCQVSDGVSSTPSYLNDNTSASKKDLELTDEKPKKKQRSRDKGKKKQAVEDILVTVEDKSNKPGAGNEDRKTSKENPLEFDDSVSFKDMLQIIRFRRNQLCAFPDENRADMEHLHEIETLINFVDSGDIPLDIILGYLQNCNRELHKVVGGNSKTDALLNNEHL